MLQASIPTETSRTLSSDRAGPDVTLMLQQAGFGDERAIDALLPLVYDELRELAARFLRGERREHTLQPTALVHETYLRLVGGPEMNWENRAHFFATAATVIRRILLKHARSKNCAKRGGAWRHVQFDDAATVEVQDIDIIGLDEALVRLGSFAPQELSVVELRFFAGLNVEETAEVLGVSPRTVARNWRLAKAWLRRELDGEPVDEA